MIVIEADVEITALGGLGDGVAQHAGAPLYVPKSCVGDRLRVRAGHENYAEIIEILHAGPDRRAAPCEYFDRCGGCALQQLSAESYREFKTKIFHDSLARAGFPEVRGDVEFLPSATRRRVEFNIAWNNNIPSLAFYAPRSHQPIAISRCPVLVPALQTIITPLNAALAAWPFARSIAALSLTLADAGVDMVLTLKHNALPDAAMLVRDAALLGIARVSARTADKKLHVLVKHAPVEMRLRPCAVPLPPDAFLQATAQGQHLLTDFAIAATQHATQLVDLFCGIGTYSLPLAAHTQVHAMEGDAAMTGALRNAAKRQNISALSVEARDLCKHPLTARELNRFDAAIINPPRAGAAAQVQELAASQLKNIVMISCNPATFARDALTLKQAGFALTRAQGIDQFVWNPHLEIAAQFQRS